VAGIGLLDGIHGKGADGVGKFATRGHQCSPRGLREKMPLSPIPREAVAVSSRLRRRRALEINLALINFPRL
jgi:hypothetical protein